MSSRPVVLPIYSPAKALLSPREAQVVRLVAASYTTPEIAAELGISGRTVESYRQSIRWKTGASTRVQVALYAVREGLVKA